MRLKVALLLIMGTLIWSAVPAGAAGFSGLFNDDDQSVHEPAIEAMARAGITVGCNPPASNLFCPESVLTRGQMAAFLHRSFAETLTAGTPTQFVDDNDSPFRADIEWLSATGVTRGCDPPANTRFCPNAPVTRGQMAAFLVRALGLSSRGSIDFVDDDGSVFEADIERLAAAGITIGCNPPQNDRFCPTSSVTRSQMASFLARALDLPQFPPVIDLNTGWWCAKDGLTCSGTANSGPNRTVTVTEGWDQVLPYAQGEEGAFTSATTRFDLLIDGVMRPTPAPTQTGGSGVATRRWTSTLVTPASGTFSIEGRWYWQNTLVRRTRIVVTVG